jgi:hypothetical protein
VEYNQLIKKAWYSQARQHMNIFNLKFKYGSVQEIEELNFQFIHEIILEINLPF